MTASIPKQDQTIKGSKEHYLSGQKHNLQIVRVIPFIKLQDDTETTVKRWKMMKSEMES